jgi:hypothetical protein
MNKLYCIKFSDSDGNTIGYRADTLGSIDNHWGKCYGSLDTIKRIYNSTLESAHRKLALALNSVNSDGAELIGGGANTAESLREKSRYVTILEVIQNGDFNENAYSREEFDKLLESAKEIETRSL